MEIARAGKGAILDWLVCWFVVPVRSAAWNHVARPRIARVRTQGSNGRLDGEDRRVAEKKGPPVAAYPCWDVSGSNGAEAIA